MKLSLRPMTTDDLESAGLIAMAAYKRSTTFEPALRNLFKIQPSAWFLALLDGEPVGLGGATDYGPFAYLGMMSVLPKAQNQGIGAALMESILGWLDQRGCPTVLLNARSRAASLYKRYGFNEIDQTIQLRRAEDTPFPQRPVQGTATLAEAELADLITLDARAFGASRANVFVAYLGKDPDQFLISKDARANLNGFLQFGPGFLRAWHATNKEIAEQLLCQALALQPASSSLQVSVPASNAAALDLCRSYGFTLFDTLPHMFRGQPPQRDPEQHLYALTSLALG